MAQITRVNLDATLTPTLLFHIGAGYLELSNPAGGAPYDQRNGLFRQGIPFTDYQYFSYPGGMSSALGGGWSGGGPCPAVTNTSVPTMLPIRW